MKNNTINSIVRSFIIIPVLASTLSMNTFTAKVQEAILAQGKSEVVATPQELALQKEREEKAAKIDAYYGKYDLPLTGYGMVMVLAGEKYNVDPFLLASINMKESTGCKYHIKGTHNCSGWAGGKTKYSSYEEGIYTLAMNLGGENPKTAHYYKGKTIQGILSTYNSVIPTYTEEIMRIMKRIDQITV